MKKTLISLTVLIILVFIMIIVTSFTEIISNKKPFIVSTPITTPLVTNTDEITNMEGLLKAISFNSYGLNHSLVNNKLIYDTKFNGSEIEIPDSYGIEPADSIYLGVSSIYIGVTDENNKEGCQPTTYIDYRENATSTERTINNVLYNIYDNYNASMGDNLTLKEYATWRNNTCYSIALWYTTTRIEKLYDKSDPKYAEAKIAREKRKIALDALFEKILQSVQIQNVSRNF